jgi:hypothetical protein
MFEKLEKDLGQDIDPETGNFIDKPTVQSGFEKYELTAEVETKVMEKVQDIDKGGTAFTSIRNGVDKTKIIDILRSGLLGNDGFTSRGKETNFSDRVENWKKGTREWNLPSNRIWFNIVGRIANISGSQQIKQTHMANFTATILFDLSDYKELPPGSLSAIQDKGRPDFKVLGRFSSESTTGKMKYYFEKAKNNFSNNPMHSSHKTDQGTGFSTAFRISPHMFTGIVIDSSSESTRQSVIDAMADLTQENSSLIQPVYDLDGNLLWPKQMSYYEVKQFVVEREANKEESGGTL